MKTNGSKSHRPHEGEYTLLRTLMGAAATFALFIGLPLCIALILTYCTAKQPQKDAPPLPSAPIENRVQQHNSGPSAPAHEQQQQSSGRAPAPTATH